MTLSTTTNKVQYNGDGTTVAFTINFEFPTNADIAVIHKDASDVETTWVLNTQYTLIGAGNSGGGTLTVDTTPVDYTPAVGETLTIKRVLTLTQTDDYTENDNLPAETLEDSLDKTVMMLQQVQEQISRAIVLSETSGVSASVTFPDPVADKSLIFNPAGDAIIAGPTSSEIAAAQTEAVAAAASATAALVSELAAAADLVLTNADVVSTNADVVLTAADLVLTNADVVSTAADVVLVAADLDEFTDLYLGSKTSDPTLDNDGSALQDGALYFNTTTPVMRVYDLSTTTWLDGTTQAAAAAASAAAALVSENAAAADLVLTNADVVLTAADVVLTAADVVSVAATYDNFDDRYLGEFASDPTVDNDGNALVSGALYFKTGSVMRVYNGSAWQEVSDTSTWDGSARTISTSSPSGGADDDFWFKYIA